MGFLGLDYFLQGPATELLVADKVDPSHLRARPFVDLKHQIDAVLVELDDLGLDGGGEAAVAAVKVDDALDVVLDAGAGVDDARPELQFGRQSAFLVVGKVQALGCRAFEPVHRAVQAVQRCLQIRHRVFGPLSFQWVCASAHSVTRDGPTRQ